MRQEQEICHQTGHKQTLHVRESNASENDMQKVRWDVYVSSVKEFLSCDFEKKKNSRP